VIRLGLDPGKTTGYAVMIDGEYALGGEIKSLPELERLFDDVNPDEVVIEDFYVKSPRVEWRAPLEMIGATSLLCYQRGIQMFRQSPAILQAWKSRAQGRVRSPHTTSALAHLMYRESKVG
jgi:Holliday junction resolvasome RuvABC endonuclease subunit